MSQHRRPNSLTAWLSKPIIPVVSSASENESLLAAASVIILQGGELAGLAELLESFKVGRLARIPLMLHLDLLDGLNNDEAGLRFIAGMERINGVITVRHHLVAAARRLGLASVVRLFLHDSRAVDRGLAIVEKTKPDAIELLPGIAAADLADVFNRVPIPRIAGGLVRTPQLVRKILDSGCCAVSSSNPNLWRLNE